MILHAKQSERAGVRATIHPQTPYSSGVWDKGEEGLKTKNYERDPIVLLITPIYFN